MRRLALAAYCLLTACGGDAPPSDGEVASAVSVALTERRDLQSRFIDQRIGLATHVGFASPTSVRLAAPPVKDETTGKWRIRVAVSGSFTATLPPLPRPVRLPDSLDRLKVGTTSRPETAVPPKTNAQPLPQHLSQSYDVRFDTYIDRQDGVWLIP